MKRLHCKECGKPMQRWGHTRQQKPRFYCSSCKRTATPQRDDVERRHDLQQFKKWLLGKDTLSEIAVDARVTRQALWKRFQKVLREAEVEPSLPNFIATKHLIVDATYIHGHALCALIAIDENDKIYWKFAPYESSASWQHFLSSFTKPDIIIMDGQKGLFMAAKTLWPNVRIQRCQFHLVSFVLQYVGRKPKEAIGKDLMSLLYELKHAKTHALRDTWVQAYFRWEKKYEHFLLAKDARGQFLRPRLRSARLIIRRALPHLFTFLDHESAPNTTNLVEGWINGRIAEALRLHRGLRVHEKKALTTTILSQLARKKSRSDEPHDRAAFVQERLALREKSRARRFGHYRKTVGASTNTLPGLFNSG